MELVPYLLSKTPHDEIAKRFGVTRATISRWAARDDVRQACEDVGESIRTATLVTGEEIVTHALAGLKTLVQSAADEKTKLDAIKTALDRFGHPATARSEAKVETVTPPGSREEAVARLEALLVKLKGGA